MRITAIKPQKKGRNRLNIYVDGEFALGLNASAFEEADIHVGKELSNSELEMLKDTDQRFQALDRARRYLATRPRSESEVRNRMQRYGYDEQIIVRVIEQLSRSGLIDDNAFAAFWRENRTSFKPRSARMVTSELRQKGVDPETIAQAVSDIDEENQAFRAGAGKARSLPSDDYYEFRRKLSAFLRRRGFDYDVISSTVERLWHEKIK